MTDARANLIEQLGDPMTQAWSVPGNPLPVVIIGAGSIIDDGHAPAYEALGIPIACIHDIDTDRARRMAKKWNIPRVLETFEPPDEDVVYDLAVPADAIEEVLDGLPDGSNVLIQKPMGTTLLQASSILDQLERRRMVAGVNLQLKFAPSMLALAHAVHTGLLGTILDVEVNVQCLHPWSNWPFLQNIPRVELLYHSIHYIDMIRRLIGDPDAVQARTMDHPGAPGIASTRSAVILEYPKTRCVLSVNHHHDWGSEHARSHMKIEGTEGAAIVRMGVNLDYPRGLDDQLQVTTGSGWIDVPLRGNWFPTAFEGPMSNLQRFVTGEDESLACSAGDAWMTMSVIEACYEADARGGVPVSRRADP